MPLQFLKILQTSRSIVYPQPYTRRAASEVPYSCLVLKDIGKLDPDLYPKRFELHKLQEGLYKGSGDLGPRISFDIPDHVPDICNERKKPNGSCSVALKCICHAKECSMISSSFHLVYTLYCNVSIDLMVFS
ncbi:hypothetical protein V6N13_094632 [Hibiscus sabdariffa]|uniref:Uncharacterized protein n=1 Tax=Hibiscus sabdariffa TaxID=183260 RepID=A0ABR2PP74_9ROSI